MELSVFDLETGGDLARGKRFAVPMGQEALHGHSAEILLGGVMDGDISGYEFLFGDGNERGLLHYLVQRLDAVYNAGGAIIGHNVVGFDIPMIVERCRLKKVVCPPWMALAASKMRRGQFERSRVFDTLHLYAPYAKFSSCGMSLGDTSAFWGRTFESHGAKFGEIWNNGEPDDRKNLKLYNLWNLLDSMSLAVFTGTADVVRGGAGVGLDSSALPALPWAPSERYEAYPVPQRLTATATESDARVFTWLTAPVPSLFNDGPSATREWGQISSEDAKLKYPHQSGRQNPQAVRIVGAIGADADGVTFVFDRDDEAKAICDGLQWLNDRLGGARIWVQDMAGFRALAVYRASLYNGIVPTWVTYGQRDSLCDLSRLEAAGLDKGSAWTIGNVAAARAMVSDASQVAHPPLYCGQAEDELREASLIWMDAARLFLSLSPGLTVE